MSSQAANIGAHQRGQSSLDFRLRDSSHISQQITRLLQDLARILNEVLDQLASEKNEEFRDDDSLGSWPDENPQTEIQQLHGEVINIIDCLNQLSMLVRIPAELDLSTSARVGSKSAYEFYDKDHVRNSYPKTDEKTISWLGRAITQRRNHLDYRLQLHAQSKEGIQSVRTLTTDDDLAEDVGVEDPDAIPDMSETSDQSPCIESSGSVSIPLPPWQSMGGKPFECPYCFFIIEVKNEQSWIQHIFKDLRPYVCTFPNCSTPDKMYDSRHKWHVHQSTEHRIEGSQCPLCGNTPESIKDFERHVSRDLEELALFALPRPHQPEIEGDYMYTSYAASGTIPDDIESRTSEEDAEANEFGAQPYSRRSNESSLTVAKGKDPA